MGIGLMMGGWKGGAMGKDKGNGKGQGIGVGDDGSGRGRCWGRAGRVKAIGMC